MALDPERTKPEIDFPEGETPADLVIQDLIEGCLLYTSDAADE